jgi:2-polyprenyl-6-methoxyphenol hydroxylase-like FAD-dependent oxidoreductase
MEAQYDLILVGGGLGGSTLGKCMAERGYRVLVLERERQFKDRVRGELMTPWGADEARQLGILELLLDGVAHRVPWVDFYDGSNLTIHRDLTTTTPQRLPFVSFYHPAMQERLLDVAEHSGVEIRRGVSVTNVKPGTPVTITMECEGKAESLAARMVIGADGRSSTVRTSCGFAQQRDPEGRMMAGLLVENCSAPEDIAQLYINSKLGRIVGIFPQGRGKARCYLAFHADDQRYQGAADIPRFIADSQAAGANPAFFAGVKPIGPLASFSGAQTWVEHPYRDGVGLIGDAAAASDPSWGQGLALTLRDVRVLRDQLLATDDWDAAGHAYAQEHDRYNHIIHTVDNWMSEFHLTTGAEADARRARANPLIAQDPTRAPDHGFSGPEMPFGEEVRRRFFAEDAEAAAAG